MSITCDTTKSEGPGLTLTPEATFKYSSLSNEAVSAYNEYGRRLTKEEAVEKYKNLHQGVEGASIWSSYSATGKKITQDQARIRDEADEFFLRPQKNMPGRAGFWRS